MLDARAEFLRKLPIVAESRIDRAILIVSFSKQIESVPSLSVRDICDFFELAHLARPNPSVLSDKLTSDRRVSFRGRRAKALHPADVNLKELMPELFSAASAPLAVRVDTRLLSGAPFIDADYLTELQDMAGLYEGLHVLENSMRRLIECVLSRELGEDWWDMAASAPMKRKHEERLQKETSRKWLPARAELGPLYSIDWADLITVIRKYEDKFQPFIGEISFMHRYADLGLLRHVIAHHGFIEDPEAEAQRVAVALRDWNNQVAPAVRSYLGAS